MTSKMRPRAGCVEMVEGLAVLTPIGLAHVREMAALGSNKTKIAKYMRIPVSTFTDWLDPENVRYIPEIHEAFLDGEQELESRIQRAQLDLMETNSQVAIHLGKHYLGQHDRPVEHNHRVAVVGTLPDYSQSSDDWAKSFAPTPLQDKVKALDIIEAEVVEDEEK